MRLSSTDGCFHISACIAGQTTTGAVVASRTAPSRSCAMPAAVSARKFAVAGATSTRSAAWPRWVCGIGSCGSNSSVRAGSEASAEKVAVPTKRVAAGVRTGMTCAPASTNWRQTSTAL